MDVSRRRADHDRYRWGEQQPPPPPAPPASVPAAASATGAAVGALRELRVEDALLYLDEVKREFVHRPAIYNEFLAIMKNFKMQEVDTPGVIKRVSQLFRGYNNLILGFNTFLPDGYKISMEDLARSEAEYQRELLAQQAQPPPPVQATAPTPMPTQQQQQQPQHPPPSVPPAQQQQPPPAQKPAAKIKKKLPVSSVGGGANATAPTSLTSGNLVRPAASRPWTPNATTDDRGPSKLGSTTTTAKSQSSSKGPQPLHPSVATTQNRPIVPSAPTSEHVSTAPPQQQQQKQQIQAVEFDHAISYVTKIKRRFANDPSIYHSFLEILHNYQREQRGIKEVLEQVAHLFQDHSDLLKEFTFFLPDAVQEQAKERLHRAAAESETRQALQRQQQYQKQVKPKEEEIIPVVQREDQVVVEAPPKDNERDEDGDDNGAGPKLIDMTNSSQPPVEDSKASRKRQLDGKPPAQTHHALITADQPEAYVYNSAVERQFFDATKEALTANMRDGGQAWAEFLKCLDMYAQDILSRTEMLNFVEPLLGKRHTKLFEEFKRILTAAGSSTGATPATEESWYSVPLSEIDFSRCRRCTPSYRALPRDYPAHPCSDRSPEDAKVLNDVWVSLPVGSEESYTFRHMRRNTYEETLFRVEDERFEIDMVIDSNAATLQRLLPIAEEIAILAKEDVLPMDIKGSSETSGLGGRRFQYSFDKNILGVIHRNTIARIYGDTGQEMLELMVKNPAVTVPLVVERLRQKNAEWRVVRDRLNKHWKELAEQNYYRSLDHRGLTWRTIDKRATSTRSMIAEIKDRAANGGFEGSEALKQRLEKAKEEHGSFFEVTMRDTLSVNLDLTFLPKPDRRIFTPHLSIIYASNSWAQRDAYRLLAFALERGPISPSDKERCHRIWVEFLGPWFGLSPSWMHEPAVAYQESRVETAKTSPGVEAMIVSEDDDSMEDDSAVRGRVVTEELHQADLSKVKGEDFTDHHPLPAETHVYTLYGEGKVLDYRKEDSMYTVELAFGAIGYLRRTTVLSSILPVEKSAYTRQLRSNDHTKLARHGDQLAFGTQSLYLFFRLYHILISRLNTAKELTYRVDSDPSLVTLIEQIPKANGSALGRSRYEGYMSLVYALLDGGVGGASEGGKYEDRVRSLLGHGAYELATMDKLIGHIWKNLQTLASDETMWSLIQLYRRHVEAGSFQPEAFRQEAAYLSDGEVMYAFQQCPIQDKDDSVLYMQYIGVMDEEEEVDDDEEEEPTEPSQKRQRK